MCGLFVVAVALLCVVGEWGAGPLFAEHCGRYASVQTYKLFPPFHLYTINTTFCGKGIRNVFRAGPRNGGP